MTSNGSGETEPQSGIAKRRSSALADGASDYTAKREELIRAAADVFKEKGYDATTFKDIAQILDTDRATLYYYVSSKEELLHEIVKDSVRTNVKAGEEILRGDGDAREKLKLIAERLMLSHEENYPASYVYIQEDMSRIESQKTPWAREMQEGTKRFEEIVIELFSQGIDEGIFREDIPPQLGANALFGMLNWTHRWYKPGGTWNAAELADKFSSVLFEGLDAAGAET